MPMLDAMNAARQGMIDRAATLFEEHFNAAPTHAAIAPGRVNLIGEHTDYNEGYVLPMAIDRFTAVVARVNRSKRCRVVAGNVGDGDTATFMLDALAPGQVGWANYVKGVLKRFIDNGQRIPPFDAAISSSLPMGAGLASSAALTVGVATLVEGLLGIRVDPARKARWCQEAEHEFVGVRCGIMDQTSVAMNPLGSAMMIDCRSHDARGVPIAMNDIALLVTDSGVRHDLADSEYNMRREQCEDVVVALRERYPDIRALRDAKLNQLIAVRGSLDPIGFRRARHVILENQRVLMVADALTSGYYETAGFLMHESHRSLRDDYEVSCNELNMLVRIAHELPGVYGARMTGGGFGGCTVTLCRADAVDAVMAGLKRGYEEHIGREPVCVRVLPAEAAKFTLIVGR